MIFNIVVNFLVSSKANYIYYVILKLSSDWTRSVRYISLHKSRKLKMLYFLITTCDIYGYILNYFQHIFQKNLSLHMTVNMKNCLCPFHMFQEELTQLLREIINRHISKLVCFIYEILKLLISFSYIRWPYKSGMTETLQEDKMFNSCEINF